MLSQLAMERPNPDLPFATPNNKPAQQQTMASSQDQDQYQQHQHQQKHSAKLPGIESLLQSIQQREQPLISNYIYTAPIQQTHSMGYFTPYPYPYSYHPPAAPLPAIQDIRLPEIQNQPGIPITFDAYQAQKASPAAAAAESITTPLASSSRQLRNSDKTTSSSSSSPIGDDEDAVKYDSQLSKSEIQEVLAYEKEVTKMKWTSNSRQACKFCSVSLSRKHDLRRHLRMIHLGQRDWECSKCKLKFKRRQHLEIHSLQVHEMGSLFKCNQCNHSFTTDSSRRRHIRLVHHSSDYGSNSKSEEPRE